MPKRSLEPRGLSRTEAAEYIGVAPGHFDRLVAEGRMPKPLDLGRRRVWDRVAIDKAFEQLSVDDREPKEEWRDYDP